MHRDVLKKKVENFKEPKQIEKFTEKSWSEYYDECQDLKLGNNTFRIYKCTAAKTEEIKTILVCLHGAGLTSLSWALFASLVKPHHHVISIDFRGHGATCTENDGDLSVSTIQSDLIEIIQKFNTEKTQFFFLGHSFGGAMAIHTAFHIQQNIKEIHLGGIVVIDVVEGTAIQSLTHVKELVYSRKKKFETLTEAIQYNITSKFSTNLESARVSVPSQLILKDDVYTWRTNLEETEQYWSEWYSGISSKFISIKGPKMLIVAGTDRLDNTLTIAHMQGKFQLKLVDGAGHFIQENNPKKVADLVLEFLKKFEFYNHQHK